MEGLQSGANSCTGPSPARNAAGLDQQPDAIEPGRAGLFPISYLQAAGFCSGVGDVCSGGCANCPATSVPRSLCPVSRGAVSSWAAAPGGTTSNKQAPVLHPPSSSHVNTAVTERPQQAQRPLAGSDDPGSPAQRLRLGPRGSCRERPRQVTPRWSTPRAWP